MTDLKGSKLILNESKLFPWSSRISLVPFRTFRGPLFPKPVTGQELFLAISYSKPALGKKWCVLAKRKSMESVVEKVKTLSDNCTDSIESLSNPAVLSCCLSIVLGDLTRDTCRGFLKKIRLRNGRLEPLLAIFLKNWVSDGHFEVLNRSKSEFAQKLWHKTQIFPFPFLCEGCKIFFWNLTLFLILISKILPILFS